MFERVFWWTLALIFVIARVALYRSERRQQDGLCARCGKVPGTVALGGDHFCGQCAEFTRRGYRAASQFVGFLGVSILCIIVFTGFLSEMDSSLRLEILLTLTGIGVAFFWIRRSMLAKGVK